MSKHYIGMAGLHGCMPQCCDVYDSKADAAQGLAQVHDLSDRKMRMLKKDMYLELDLHRDGNEYCEIIECSCNTPEVHSDY